MPVNPTSEDPVLDWEDDILQEPIEAFTILSAKKQGLDSDVFSTNLRIDSSEDFAIKINKLLTGNSSTSIPIPSKDNSSITKHIERPKKPSTRWTLEEGYLALPPLSSMKRGKSSPVKILLLLFQFQIGLISNLSITAWHVV